MKALPLAAAAAALSLLAVACGGSPQSGIAEVAGTTTAKSTGGPAATDKGAAALAYARCMRSHGVSGFPDPKRVGGSIQVSGSTSGMDPQSPAFRSAQRACRRLLPGGAPTRAHRETAVARMLRVSQCMRAHGIAGFPDPTPSPPAKGRAGTGVVVSNGYAWLAIPSSIDTRAPAFTRAAATCKLGLP